MSLNNIAFLADQDNCLRLAHWIVDRCYTVDGKLMLTPSVIADQFDGNIDSTVYEQIVELCANVPPPPPNKFTAALMAYQLNPTAKHFAEVVRVGQAQGIPLETIYSRMNE